MNSALPQYYPVDQPRAFLLAQPFAHRGLYNAAAGVPENSRAAFEHAIERGLGFELDVQLSRDGEAMVFHDEALDRLTGEPGLIADLPAAAIEKLKLLGSDETVPRLGDVLRQTARRAPILIEIKSTAAARAGLCAAVRHALEGYKGEVAVMSFDPYAIRWFADHAPNVARGLVLTTHGGSGFARLLRGSVTQKLAARRARAQFFAYDLRSLPNPFSRWAQANHLPLLTWTVRGETAADFAFNHADNIIFETLPEDWTAN